MVLGRSTGGVLMVMVPLVKEMGSTCRCPSLTTLFHAAGCAKPEPWMTTSVPPRIGPVAGETLVTLGSR